jgi:[ribosomal protein S5]-alanine N-acetyltransferase
MALFRLSLFVEPSTVVRGRQVYLRYAEMRDYDDWAKLRAQSREFLEPWEPTWPTDDLSRAAFRRRLRRNRDEILSDEAYPFLIFRVADNVLVGGLTLGQVRRGVAQTATLGYWMGEAHAGHGLMSNAVRAVIDHAFGPLGLRRIEAACLPHNQRSIRLLERLGFRKEGIARAYLQINGRWQDHLFYALLDSDVPPPVKQR